MYLLMAVVFVVAVVVVVLIAAVAAVVVVAAVAKFIPSSVGKHRPVLFGEGTVVVVVVAAAGTASTGDFPRTSHWLHMQCWSSLSYSGSVSRIHCRYSEKNRSPVSSINFSTFEKGTAFAPASLAILLTQASCEWL